MAFLNEEGLAELWSLIRAKDLKMKAGSYVGKGKYGKNNPNSLTFDFEPKLLVVGNADSAPMVMVCSEAELFCSWHDSRGVYECTCVRNGKTVSWWNRNYLPVLGSTEGENPMGQKDFSGTTYHYVAIG